MITDDGKVKVNATFNNIEENNMYSVKLNITYKDGVVLQLEPKEEISECILVDTECVWFILITFHNRNIRCV